MANICLYTEELNAPFDEGYRNFTYNLFREAPVKRKVLRLGSGEPEVIDLQVGANKLLLSRRLRGAIREFRPDAVVYVPTASVTPASFVRARVLKWQAGGVPLAMIGLQPRTYSKWVRPILRAIAPDMIYVQSEASRKALEAVGLRASVIHAGVDAERFRPVEAAEKSRLRERYGISSTEFIVLHVGHINEGRNLRALADIAAMPEFGVLLVGSTSTPQDSNLAMWLSKNGVRILDTYIEHIEEVYQLSDLYVFPVGESTSAIEFPLSVLEAMACNLPVVATRFGGLTDCFREGEGLHFAGSSTDLVAKCRVAGQGADVRTREKVESFSWLGVADRFFTEIEQLPAKRSPGRVC